MKYKERVSSNVILDLAKQMFHIGMLTGFLSIMSHALSFVTLSAICLGFCVFCFLAAFDLKELVSK